VPAEPVLGQHPCVDLVSLYARRNCDRPHQCIGDIVHLPGRGPVDFYAPSLRFFYKLMEKVVWAGLPIIRIRLNFTVTQERAGSLPMKQPFDQRVTM